MSLPYPWLCRHCRWDLLNKADWRSKAEKYLIVLTAALGCNTASMMTTWDVYTKNIDSSLGHPRLRVHKIKMIAADEKKRILTQQDTENLKSFLTVWGIINILKNHLILVTKMGGHGCFRGNKKQNNEVHVIYKT